MDTHLKGRSEKGYISSTSLETEARINNHVDNIGRNGLLCYSNKYFDVMTMLDMRFQIPCFPEREDNMFHHNWIECQGVVVNCEPATLYPSEKHYEVAVYFSEISEEYKTILADFINTVSRDRV